MNEINRSVIIGKKVLVTCDNWLHCPDGKTYKAIHGTVKGLYDAIEVLGIKPNAKSTNWYLQIGNTTVAGCQIHYIVECETFNKEDVEDYATGSGEFKKYIRPCNIFNADEI